MMKVVSYIFNKISKRLLSANFYAKLIGVRVGAGARLNKSVNFGSEPYLISIGKDFYCSVNIFFVTHDGSVNLFRNIYSECKNIDYFQPISIGDNVFIGCNVTILPGTVIGSNVIVGAGSVVKGVLDSDSIYAGVPARKIMSIGEFYKRHRESFVHTHKMDKNKKRVFLENHFNVR
ncbi:acyltransferase [Aeromonas salmonicida subsp. pectinolytica]